MNAPQSATGAIAVWLSAGGAVRVRNRRRNDLRGALEGCAVEGWVERVGQLCSLCSEAQQAAAEAALLSALGRAGANPDARRRRVRGEALREHGWHIACLWPALSGAANADTVREFAPVYRQLEADRRADRRADPEPLIDWLAGGDFAALAGLRDLDDLQAWCRGGKGPAQRALRAVFERALAAEGAAPVAPLRADELPALARAMAAPGEASARFCARPELDGAARDPLGEGPHWPLLDTVRAVSGPALLWRLLRRLAALQQLQIEAEPPRPPALPRGSAAIYTARGWLLHAVAVARGRISHARQLAPTEWQCTPAGPLRQALQSLSADHPVGRAERAERVIEALDPCTDWRLETP